MILDHRQSYLADKFSKIAASIKPQSGLGLFKKIFFNTSKYHGVYFYGGVGRGKTMLMQRFYDDLNLPKKMVHYQQFMQEIHKKMHDLRDNQSDKLVYNLSKDIANQCNVLCMDEFEIKDITDAMIIMRLFKFLKEQSVFIFVTTNTKPDDLYKDGLQRAAFLPFIDNIKKDFEIVHLDTNKDYRFDVLKDLGDRIFFPINDENSQKFLNIKSRICQNDQFTESSIEIFGRELVFKQTHNNILLTNFVELFERDLGYADYVEISKKFSIIIIASVRPILEDENNVATRFINFIDNAYFNRVLLFMEIACKPEEIYISGSRAKEFRRTISRLNEMNSNLYLKEDR